MRTKQRKVCTLPRGRSVNTLTKLTKTAWADRLGGVNTQAKGNKACGPALADRVNTMTTLVKLAKGSLTSGARNTSASSPSSRWLRVGQISFPASPDGHNDSKPALPPFHLPAYASPMLPSTAN